MLFNQILCNYCFPYLTTSPTCSEAGGAGDLVSLLIYIRKSTCVVLSKKEGQSLHGSLLLRKAYIEIIISNFFLQGGSDPCLNLKPDQMLVHPRFLMHPRIGCSIPNCYSPKDDFILGFHCISRII